MNRSYPMVPLGEVLLRRRDATAISDSNEYKRLTIRMNGGGVIVRDVLIGNEIGTKRQFIVSQGQLLLSKIDARNGAFGVVPPECDEAIITGNFWTFDALRGKLDVRYLNYLTKTRLFVNRCIRASEGTTNRLYLQEDLFLEQEIPLPPLPEQRRIVARIEQLAARVEEARGLRRQAVEEAESLHTSALASTMKSYSVSWQQQTVADVLLSMDAGWSPRCDDQPATANEWGVLKTTSVQWSRFNPMQNKVLLTSSAPRPHLAVDAGDVLVTRAGPRKRVGVVAAVRQAQPQLMISDKLIRLRPDQSKVIPRFLELSLASPFSQEHLVKRKTGLADAQVNISQGILRSTPVAFPPLPEQQRIVSYLDDLQAKVDSLKQLQAETAVELDALLPSVLDRAFKGHL